MPYKFAATIVSMEDDGEIVMIVFIDDETSPVKYLMFQWENEDAIADDSEVSPKIYMELNDQIQSVHGGLREILCKNHTVTFLFDDHASNALRIDGAIEVEIINQNSELALAMNKLETVAHLYGLTIKRIG